MFVNTFRFSGAIFQNWSWPPKEYVITSTLKIIQTTTKVILTTNKLVLVIEKVI